MLRCLILFAVLLALPVRAELFKPATFALENGLTAVVIVDHRAPAVTHMVWYKVGSSDDPTGKSGLAHYLEHLMFKGSPNVPAGELSKSVGAAGGHDNAFTAPDYTAYFQTVPSARLEEVMRLEADRMADLLLNPQDAVPELKVVQEERRQRYDGNPEGAFGETFNALQWAGHPRARPGIGWPAELAGLTVTDARAFYERHYAPNNAILVVAGDVDPDQVRVLAEKYYGPVAARVLPARVQPPAPPQNAPRRFTREDARVVRPALQRAYLVPMTAELDIEAAEILAEILNAVPRGRLQSLVRGDGPAESADAGFFAGGMVGASFWVDAAPRRGVTQDALEAALDRVIATLLKEGATAAEVDVARARAEARSLFVRDSARRGAYAFGMALATGRDVDWVETAPQRYAAVTLDAVNRMARLFLDPNRSVTGWLVTKAKAGE